MLSHVTLTTSTYISEFLIYMFSSPSGGGSHRHRCRRRVILGRMHDKRGRVVRRRPPSSHRQARPRNAGILLTHPGGGRRARAPSCGTILY